MAAAAVNRGFLSALRTQSWCQTRGLNSLAERTTSRVSSAVICNHEATGGHTSLDRRAQAGERRRRNGRDSNRSSSLLTSVSVGLGLCGAVLLDTEKDQKGDKELAISRGFLQHILPSAQCASLFKPDSPRFKYNFIADVVEKSIPAVVYIEIVGR